MLVELTERDLEIIKTSLNAILTGEAMSDIDDYEWDYDTEIGPLFVKLGDDPVSLEDEDAGE